MDRAKLSFAKMNLEGEKLTRFFCSLEKQMRKSTLLQSIMIQGKEKIEKECFNQGQIEEEVRNFYKDLYASKPTYAKKQDILKYVGYSKIKQLSDEELARLEKKIEQAEVNKCLKNTHNSRYKCLSQESILIGPLPPPSLTLDLILLSQCNRKQVGPPLLGGLFTYRCHKPL